MMYFHGSNCHLAYHMGVKYQEQIQLKMKRLNKIRTSKFII